MPNNTAEPPANPSQVITQVLLESSPAQQVPLSKLTDAFLSEGLPKAGQSWNPLRAAFANLPFLMRERLPAEDLQLSGF